MGHRHRRHQRGDGLLDCLVSCLVCYICFADDNDCRNCMDCDEWCCCEADCDDNFLNCLYLVPMLMVLVGLFLFNVDNEKTKNLGALILVGALVFLFILLMFDDRCCGHQCGHKAKMRRRQRRGGGQRSTITPLNTRNVVTRTTAVSAPVQQVMTHNPAAVAVGTPIVQSHAINMNQPQQYQFNTANYGQQHHNAALTMQRQYRGYQARMHHAPQFQPQYIYQPQYQQQMMYL